MLRGDNRVCPSAWDGALSLPAWGTWILVPQPGEQRRISDLLHCLQQQILGERNERKKAQSGEKAEVSVSLS